MSAPQLGANVDEQPEPARIGTGLHAAVEQYAAEHNAEHDAAMTHYRDQVDALLAQPAPAGPALTQLPTPRGEDDELAHLRAAQPVIGAERAELGQLRQLYRAGEFITPLPDAIDPDGRARWHGTGRREGPGWLVMRMTDGRVYADPGAPLFTPTTRERATAFALALLAATGPAPTTTKAEL